MSKLSEPKTRNLWVAAILVAAGLVTGVLFTARMDWTPASVAESSAPPVNYQYAVSSIPLVTPEGESPFVAVAERVAPTVVNITTDRKVTQNDQMEDFFRDSPFWEFFHRDQPQQRQRRPREYHMPATGSGIIISKDGYILTNNHVVEEADKVIVKVRSGREYTAEIIGTDPETDVAVIKVDHAFDPGEVAAIGNSDDIKIGDWAVAMGNPLGLDWTLTVGVISARGRSNLAIQGGGPSYQDFIQTDAAINFGNSGGPLCNIHGEVIGVNTAINPSGQGVGFAIPANMAMKVVDQLRSSGAVSRGYLGLLPRELTNELRSAVDLPESETGVFVERVDNGTPAEEGGMEAGDVITKFAGEKIKDVAQFRMLVADQKPGQSVSAEVWREGKKQDFSFMLGDRAKLASFLGRNNEQQSEAEPSKESWLGIEVEPVTEAVARALDLDGVYGVIVTDVDPDGPSADKLQERDVIIEIDRKAVDSMDDFREISKNLKREQRAILFRLIRNGQRTFEAVEP